MVQTLRSPLMLATQAIRPELRAAVRSDGKGALITCSKVKLEFWADTAIVQATITRRAGTALEVFMADNDTKNVLPRIYADERQPVQACAMRGRIPRVLRLQ